MLYNSHYLGGEGLINAVNVIASYLTDITTRACDATRMHTNIQKNVTCYITFITFAARASSMQ
jgi:hypothetical protein